MAAHISSIASAAVSVGVLAALVSAIFFLVLSGLRWVSRVRTSLYEEELRRRKKLLLLGRARAGRRSFGTETDDREKANAFAGGAFSRENSDGDVQRWPEAGGERNLGPRKEERKETTADERGSVNEDTVRAREFIEKLVERIIGDSLDGITVGKLSTHSAYLGIFTKYHSLLCRELARLGFSLRVSAVHENSFEFDSRNSTRSNLKKLIKRIASEALDLPDVKEISNGPEVSESTVPDNFEDKSYEDILATAILNKVIENSQKRKSSKDKTGEESRKYEKNEVKIKRNEDGEDDEEDDVVSSDWSEASRSEQLSFAIEERIEEVTTTFEISDEERCGELYADFEAKPDRRIPFPESGRMVKDRDGIYEENSDPEEPSPVTELIASSSAWEENWLFQRKRLRSTPNAHHPVPVPMLVPNPSEDFRALVGGVDADDLSDMSDCSDSALEELIAAAETAPANESAEIVAPPAEPLGRERPDPTESGTYGGERPSGEDRLENPRRQNGLEEEAISADDDGRRREDSKNTRSDATPPELLSQKDREFSVEDFDWSRRRSNSSSVADSPDGDRSPSNDDDDDDDRKERGIRCRIAEREKEKWKNAVELVDNPYSSENIEKRDRRNKNSYFRIGTYCRDYIDFPSDDLSSEELIGKTGENLRFSRDYYVNRSKYPSGSPTHRSPLGPSPIPFFEANEQNSSTKSSKEDKTTVTDSEDNKKNSSGRPTRNRRTGDGLIKRIGKNKIGLPNVKELAKRFTPEDGNVVETKEREIDYGAVPVSQIILDLRNASSTSASFCKEQDTEISKPGPETPKVRNNNDDGRVIPEEAEKNPKKWEGIESGGFNGKEVHSLTARSISREFREGLKNGSYRKALGKAERYGSAGESDRGEIVSGDVNTSPTPSVDLKNVRKFWEEIITANSVKR